MDDDFQKAVINWMQPYCAWCYLVAPAQHAMQESNSKLSMFLNAQQCCRSSAACSFPSLVQQHYTSSSSSSNSSIRSSSSSSSSSNRVSFLPCYL